MRKLILLFVLAALAALLAACVMPVAEEMAEGDMAGGEMAMDESMAEMPEMVEGELTVANVRANLTLPTDTGSVWLVIMNGTDTDDALIGGEIPGCGVVELHDMKMDGDVMVMRPVEGGQIPIPAGEMVELKKGGLHVMCIEKAAPLELGATVDMVLKFANAGDVAVTGEVVAPGDSSMMAGHGEMDGEMEERHGRRHAGRRRRRRRDGEEVGLTPPLADQLKTILNYPYGGFL